MEITWNRTWQVLFVIVLLAAGLRLYGLGNNSFVADEFLDINSSYGYAQTGEWKAWDFNYSKPAEMNMNDARDERAFVYKWQVAQLLKVLPPTETVVRSVSVLWGLVSVLVIFWATYVYTRKKEIGLIAALLFAFAVSGIIFDRRLRMYAMFFPVYLVLATVLYRFFETEYTGAPEKLRTFWKRTELNIWYVPIVVVWGVLSLAVHQLSATIVFSVAAYLIARAFAEYHATKNIKNKYVVLLTTGIIGIAALGFIAPGFVSLFTAGLVFMDNHYSYFGYIFSDYAHPLFAVVLMAFGAYTLRKTDENGRKAAWWLSLSFLVPLVLAVWFFRRNAGPQYIFFAQSFGMILAAVGIFSFWQLLVSRFAEWGKRGVVITLTLLILLTPNFGYFFEENNTYLETSSGDQPNYRKVFAYFKKNMTEGDVLISRNFRNYYWSGAKVPVYDFGGELSTEKFSLTDVEKIVAEHPHGWVIVSTNDYDYISSEAEQYFKKNMERVSNAQVRGDIEVYRWGEQKEDNGK
jgi:uncharacterized membrane protein (UPF0136 family)